MPVSEVNITVDTRDFIDYNLVAGAYRVALERNQGQIGIFNLDRNMYDEYDATAAAIGFALEAVHEPLANENIFNYNITIHSEYGHGLWPTLMEKKVQAYEHLYRKMNVNSNVTVRTGLTRPGNNPLRNHTYIAAIKGLTDVELPATLVDSNPHQWFTLQKVFAECYGPITSIGTPATDNLRNNMMEFDRIKQETPDVHYALNQAIEHLNSRQSVATTEHQQEHQLAAVVQ